MIKIFGIYFIVRACEAKQIRKNVVNDSQIIDINGIKGK